MSRLSRLAARPLPPPEGRGAMHHRLGGKPDAMKYVYLWGVFRKPTGGIHGQSRSDPKSE
jgi:hypothetical protein